MSAITNFSPIQSVNSLLKPLGLTISNKQQIITKVALAMLVITCGLATVEGKIWDLNETTFYRECKDICDMIKRQDPKAGDVLISCYTFCQNKFLF